MANALVTETSPYSTPHCFLPIWQNDEKLLVFNGLRHGFATLALCKGMPIESVSRILGHTNIETTQIYAKITVEKLDNDLTMLGDKLSKSFGNIKVAGI